MAAWIKMSLGMEQVSARLLCVRWDFAPPSPKGGGVPPVFGPCLLWPNGWMDEAGTWHGGRPQPSRLCVRWGPSPTLHKGCGAASPIFGPFLLWSNGWIDQDGTWHAGRLWSSPHCARWGHSSPPQKRGQSPQFRPIFIVTKRLDASRCHLVFRWASAQATLCYIGTQPPSLKSGQSPTIFGSRLLWQTAAWIKMPLGAEVGLGPGDLVFDGDSAKMPLGTEVNVCPAFSRLFLCPLQIWSFQQMNLYHVFPGSV